MITSIKQKVYKDIKSEHNKANNHNSYCIKKLTKAFQTRQK